MEDFSEEALPAEPTPSVPKTTIEGKDFYSVLAELYTEANSLEHTVAKLAPEEGTSAELTIRAENDGFGYKYSAYVRLSDGRLINLK